jgi:L-threonylcarbamoyladenylate synthase
MAHDPPLAVTLLLPAAAAAPRGLVGPAGLVGARRTPDDFCRRLVAAAGAPLLSTSANAAGRPPPADFADIDRALLATVDIAVDAGRTLPGTPSTVVGVEEGRAVIVREGAVDADTIARVCAGRG